MTTVRSEAVLFQCKPESVEAVHRAGAINKEAVRATGWNLLETEDTLSFETLAPLLLEEYPKVGLSLTEDKGAVMRALSSSFKKSDMKKVYSLIVRYGGTASS